MRSRLLLLIALFTLTMFSNAEEPNSQRALPTPALSTSGEGNEMSVDGIVFVRGGMNMGDGMDASLTHYFTRHLGFTADADDLTSNFVLFHEYGFRGGPTYTLRPKSRFQPFGRALFGYSRFKEINNGPTRPYVGGLSYLAGVGTDVRVVGSMFTRFAADYENDPHTGIDTTRVFRMSVGVTYKFGRYGL